VTPQFKTLPNGTYDFSNPLVKPEALVDVELGGGYSSERFHANASVFYMSFNNEIIKQGQLDRFGIPVTGNAEKTLHQGMELSAAARIVEGLDVLANATWSRNRLEKYSVFDGSTRISLDGNNIAGFPDFLANVRATYRAGALVASLSLQHVGEFYSDNFQNSGKGKTDPARTILAYTVANASVSYRASLAPIARTAEISIQANNLFNRIYVSNGEGDEFYPAAERNFFASLRFDL
jgi:iron complex outermembrane receptor protein